MVKTYSGSAIVRVFADSVVKGDDCRWSFVDLVSLHKFVLMSALSGERTLVVRCVERTLEDWGVALTAGSFGCGLRSTTSCFVILIPPF